ncbi:DUF423 domain-containing protein [Kiloniella laminariae]|uniref:DUF423 domain-containing protein n=1 Tax=Kiloniella laminariae TaxID=454162 RepID=UPI000361FC71|nr:DUF423 domain-containing protein [Kiloniella laminariae]
MVGKITTFWPKFWIVYAGLWGAGSVAVGAYAAHGFEGDELRVLWAQTGSSYGLVHTLVLLVLTALGTAGSGCSRARVFASGCFALGLLFFSGGLFLKALCGLSLNGPYIPVGGSLFVLGWLLTAAFGFTYRQKEV